MEVLTFETLLTLIVAAAPSIVAIISVLTAMVKLKKANSTKSQEVIDKFEETRQAVMDTKQYEALKTELKLAHQENRQLKKILLEYLTKLDHIAREKIEEEE